MKSGNVGIGWLITTAHLFTLPCLPSISHPGSKRLHSLLLLVLWTVLPVTFSCSQKMRLKLDRKRFNEVLETRNEMHVFWQGRVGVLFLTFSAETFLCLLLLVTLELAVLLYPLLCHNFFLMHIGNHCQLVVLQYYFVICIVLVVFVLVLLQNLNLIPKTSRVVDVEALACCCFVCQFCSWKIWHSLP